MLLKAHSSTQKDIVTHKDIDTPPTHTNGVSDILSVNLENFLDSQNNRLPESRKLLLAHGAVAGPTSYSTDT